MRRLILVSIALFPLVAATAFAKHPPKPPPKAKAEAPPAAAPASAPAAANAPPRLKVQQGEVVLGDHLAKLNVPKEFYYLSPSDTETVLSKIWGNPPGSKTLGMLIPSDTEVDAPNSWGIIITNQTDGHVNDKDANDIKYDELLKDMQDGTKEENAEREKAGYPKVTLVGWAAPPHYDASAKKLYWAKEIAFSDKPDHTLNYNIRVLGKEEVLVLNAVAGMDQLQMIQQRIPQVLSFVSFNDGHRYEEFNPSTGKMAAYGIAGLVAGGVLAKAGLFKVLLVGLLAAKKLIIVGLIAVGGFFSKFFKKKDKNAPPPVA